MAGWLALAFVLLWFANSALAAFVGTRTVAPEGAARMALLAFGLGVLALGLVAGVLNSVAFFRKHDRSWATLLGSLPAAFVVVFLLGELLIPH